MKKILITMAITGLAVLIYSGSSFADNYQKRLIKQQNQIWRGFNKGQLTPHEARHLIRKHHKIRRHIQIFKRDGHLSRKEKKRIAHWLNKSDRNTRQLLHNDRRKNRGRTSYHPWRGFEHQRHRWDRNRWHTW